LNVFLANGFGSKIEPTPGLQIKQHKVKFCTCIEFLFVLFLGTGLMMDSRQKKNYKWLAVCE
jgi:hypothetical protein